MTRSSNLRRSICTALLMAMAGLGVFASSALATGWDVQAHSFPTNLQPGARGFIEIKLLPLGAKQPEGIITITDKLPHGLTALQAGDLEQTGNSGGAAFAVEQRYAHCSIGSVVTCTLDPKVGLPFGEDAIMRLGVLVSVEQNASGTGANQVEVVGGDSPEPADTSDPVTISSSLTSFGFAGVDAMLSNADGTIDTQAGSHPYEAVFSFSLNTLFDLPEKALNPTGELKDLAVNLPAGLVGDPKAATQCTAAQLAEEGESGGKCPLSSQIGTETTSTGTGQFLDGVYNMVPPPGAPAEFAFITFGHVTYLVSRPRTGGDNGITTHVDDIIQNRQVYENIVRLWGVPADPRHDFERGTCLGINYKERAPGEALVRCPVSGQQEIPLLTLPTQCGAPPMFSLTGTSWQGGPGAEASFAMHDSRGEPVGITGCEPLHFEPQLTLAPDTSSADTPAGLTAEVTPPLGGLLEPEGRSPADLQNTTVVLPQGMAINPGQAAGLAACQASEDAVGSEEAAKCPAASKVGTVSIETPLLPEKLEGNVYVLQSNPPNLELLLAASADGVNLKIVGQVHLNETTGQLTTTFLNTPQLPFTKFKLAFSGGAQAALSTPTTCGTYSAHTDFMSWSSPFVSDALEESSFEITSGSGGAPCPSGALPFAPSLIAGSTTDQAGGFTNFSLLLQAPDDQQRIEKLQFKIPQGLLGMISKVPLCPEAQAQAGTCSSASQIGHTVVAAGPGPYPLVVPQPGQPPAPIYLTGPYKGAPFGLSIVVPLVVGPFTLQTQIVRAKIEIDPLTAQITVTTDPFPQIIDGIPTDLRTIDAVIDRPGFMFNPTNCEPMSFSGTAFSAQGASAPISTHFQMGSCQALKFQPDFKVSTSGKTSRTKGASLDVKLTYPTGPLGANQASSQSNIKSVKVDLPRQLPSRLTTLQKACPSATFEANPASCPVDSRVGQVEAVTPVLPVPLTGPAYFVSYGGAKFPELVFVLQGYGVTVYIHGETFISPAGITSSTIRRVPDVPIASFELKLPEGPFSALGANTNLCKVKGGLKMPTAFTAQDGAVIKQSTSISVTGCPKAKAKKAKQKTRKGHKKK